MTAFHDSVVETIRALAPGEVVTYGEIAAQAGHPGAARAVGTILRDADGLPWWRVVSSTGRLVPGAETRQARKLAVEGVDVRDGRVKLQPMSRRTTHERR